MQSQHSFSLKKFSLTFGLTISWIDPAPQGSLASWSDSLELSASISTVSRSWFSYSDNLLCSSSSFKVLEIMRWKKLLLTWVPKSLECKRPLPLPFLRFKLTFKCQITTLPAGSLLWLLGGSSLSGQELKARGLMACLIILLSSCRAFIPSSNYCIVCYLCISHPTSSGNVVAGVVRHRWGGEWTGEMLQFVLTIESFR